MWLTWVERLGTLLLIFFGRSRLLDFFNRSCRFPFWKPFAWSFCASDGRKYIHACLFFCCMFCACVTFSNKQSNKKMDRFLRVPKRTLKPHGNLHQPQKKTQTAMWPTNKNWFLKALEEKIYNNSKIWGALVVVELLPACWTIFAAGAKKVKENKKNISTRRGGNKKGIRFDTRTLQLCVSRG